MSATPDVLLASPSDAARLRMDFTRRDFWRGAWAAWGIFMLSLTAALVIVGLVQVDGSYGSPFALAFLMLFYGVPIGGAISLIAMLLGAPIAWGISRLLLRTDSVARHLAAYAGLGGGVGAAVIAVTQVLSRSTSPAVGAPLALAIVAVCIVSVAGGWAWTFARSRAERSA
ncbi:hypothetical protein [Microbacterium oxydans]|uniref:Uncharacterized protein n=1 Tax=Microbacterium oxydans TaxID=82380 RepID=A0A0F0L6A4_9MICO|nr:hypothetical protein [Microbacterium oxydans]KJL27840.1 hypothetical protein RS83_02896 [Microbacterium oxydans]